MSYKQMDFTISFHNQLIKNYIIETDFEIVFQTSIQSIEKYCKEKYPTLITHKQYSTDELAQLVLMKNYIKKNLNSNDITYIHNYFYEKHWFEPLSYISNITSIKLTDYNCKMWSDPELPYLEIKGIISLDLKKLVDLYLNKKKYYDIILPYSQKVVSKVSSIKFNRAFPLYVTYKGGVEFRNQVLNIVKDYIKNKIPNNIKQVIEKKMKINNIDEYKMEVNWKSSDEIEININDAMKLLKLKIKENFLPMAGGFVLYRNLK